MEQRLYWLIWTMTTAELLKEYLGEDRSRLIQDYLVKSNCQLLLRAPRKSKLGDFSVRAGRKRITINRDLNPYRFTLTLVHELAHLMTYQNHKWKVKPHGVEWKNNYRSLLEMWQIRGLFSNSEPLLSLFEQEFFHPSACSGIHVEKEMVLSQFDQRAGQVMLKEIADNQHFEFKGQLYSKGVLRRTRYLCRRLTNGKLYTIHQASWVKPSE